MPRQVTPSILDDVLTTNVVDQPNTVHAIHLVSLTRLEDNPYQTRTRNDPDHVLNLAASLLAMAPTLPATAGLQQVPIGRIVRYADGFAYGPEIYANPTRLAHLLADDGNIVELAFGHSRRLAFLVLANGPAHVFKELPAARINEWTVQIGEIGNATITAAYQSMPVRLVHLTDQQMWEHAITENAQRLGLTPIEEAVAIERARKEFGMTYDQAGALFGKSRGAAANLVRLLQLPDDVQQMVMDGQLTERHGRELVALTADPQRLRNAAATTVKHNHTVKQLAEAVKYETKRMEEAQEKERQIAKARAILAAGYVPFNQGDPLPADRLDLDMGAWQGVRITPADAGRCSAACPCLKAIHVDYQSSQDVYLDPDARNVVLCCANRDRHEDLAKAVPPTAETKAAQAAAVAERQQQLDAQAAAAQAEYDRIQAEADAIWTEVLERCDRTTLWNSIDFWRMTSKAIERSYYWWDKQLKDADLVTVQDLAERILLRYRDDHQEYITAANRTTYNVDKLRKSAKALLKLAGKTEREKWPDAGDIATMPTATLDQCIAAVWAHVKSQSEDAAGRLESAKGVSTLKLAERLPSTVVDAEIMEGARQRVVDDLAGQIAHAAKKAARRPSNLQSPISNLHSWTDADETSHQCLMSEWDGRSWATLAKLAYTCATSPDAPCTITPAVASRLAAECPNPDDKASLLATAARLETFSRENTEAANG